MLTELEVAAMLSGRTRQEESAGRQTSTAIAALAASDSSNGTVMVDLGGTTVSQDGQQEVEIPTTVDVRAGDTVRVTIDGAEGSARRPTVTGVIGGGDRMRADVDGAVSDASTAKTDAATAKSTADGAQKSADSASDTASSAAEAAQKAQQAADAAQAQATQTAETLAQAQEYLDGIRQWVSDGQSYLGFQDVGKSTAQLTIANRDSSFYTTLTNTRQEYRNGGATIMAIDGQHGRVEASALAVGSYEWQSTNAGANMTLVYIG